MTRCFDKSTKNWCSVASLVVEVYAWSTIWNFFDFTWPQWPLTEKVLKFNMSFHDSVKNVFFSKHQNKVTFAIKLLNSRSWKSSVVTFQALETSPASLTSAAVQDSGPWITPPYNFFISILAVSNPSEETVVNISNLMDDTRRRRSLISERPLTSTSAIVRSYSSSSFESPDEEDNSSDDWGDSDSERRREISWQSW